MLDVLLHKEKAVGAKIQVAIGSQLSRVVRVSK